MGVSRLVPRGINMLEIINVVDAFVFILGISMAMQMLCSQFSGKCFGAGRMGAK
jgi:anthranilate/para-aminobenzoate synthase component II